MIDFEQIEQEASIWPWLDSDCMADEKTEDFFDALSDFEEFEDFE